MIPYAEKLLMFDKGLVRAKDRRVTEDRLQWFKIIGDSIYAGFSEFIIATRFAYPTLDDVYENWDQPAAAIANDSKTVGELFEIYCYTLPRRNYIQVRWLNVEFMPKFRPSVGENLGLNDLYKTQYQLFVDLMQVCIKTGSQERVIESLNKFNAAFQRHEHGFVPTPTPIAQRMIDMLDVTLDDTVVDPTCGRGIFLTLLRKKHGNDLRIYGIEKDVGKAYLAAAFLDPTHTTVNNIYVKDSLTIKSYDKEIFKVSKNAVALSNLIEGGTRKPSKVVFVGNPPYHDSDHQFGDSPRPIYNVFVEHALRHGDEVLFVIPARWYAAGRGLTKFRSQMLTGKVVKQIVDFPSSKSVFTNVDIPGGVCFFTGIG